MLRQFYMNGDLWRVQFVSPHDSVLIDRTGNRTLGVSDYSTHIISIANNLYGELLNRVFIHELGHCVMFSYGQETVLGGCRGICMQYSGRLWTVCYWHSQRYFRKPVHICSSHWGRKDDCIDGKSRKHNYF